MKQQTLEMQDQADLARYCHLPLGNMGGDAIILTADTIFARCLRDAKHVLWSSDPSLPDVAGRDSDSTPAEQLLESNQLSMEVHFPNSLMRQTCSRHPMQ